VSRPPKAPAQRGEAPGRERARCHGRQATAEMRRRRRRDRCCAGWRRSAETSLRTPRSHDAFPRMLGPDAKAAGGGEEVASEAWVNAYTRYAVQVMHDYPDDKVLQRELLGAYDVQLEQQRSVERLAKRARRARAKAMAQALAQIEQPAPPPEA